MSEVSLWFGFSRSTLGSVTSLDSRHLRRWTLRTLVFMPLSGLLGGMVWVLFSVVTSPVPAFSQTPIPADAEISLIADHEVSSVFSDLRFEGSDFNRSECSWASDSEAGALAGPNLIRWGDGQRTCGFYGPVGEFVLRVGPTWEGPDEIRCTFGLPLATGQGGCLIPTLWGAWSVSFRVDGHLVLIYSVKPIDRHKLVGFANLISTRMKGNLGRIDELSTAA